jgi:hypothetical protein
LPTVTQYFDATGRLYEYYPNGSTCTAASTSQTLYQYQQFTVGGTPTVVANSPYVLDEWRLWNTSTATYCTIDSNQLWQTWTSQQTYGNSSNTYHSIAPSLPMSPEELTRHQEAVEKAKVKAANAKVRARSLLGSMLTEEQRQYMERHGYIPVIGSKGRRYHIRTTGGPSGNVALVGDDDAVIGRFCAHPTATHDGKYIPNEDQFLAQLLHLQDDEDSFLGVANIVEGHNPVRQHPLVGIGRR